MANEPRGISMNSTDIRRMFENLFYNEAIEAAASIVESINGDDHTIVIAAQKIRELKR